MAVPLFVLACLTGARPTIHGDGEQARDFTYIDDAIEANVLAMRASSQAWGGVFNVGGGQTPTSVNSLLAIIAEITGARPQPVHGPSRPGDVRRTHADVTRAHDILGYTPRTLLRIGLEHTVEWFRTHTASDAGRRI
jgi:nucleoside-diphosphate-sugar epimerase